MDIIKDAWYLKVPCYLCGQILDRVHHYSRNDKEHYICFGCRRKQKRERALKYKQNKKVPGS